MDAPSAAARLQRILLPTDGSEHSEGALRVAIEAAAKCSSELFAFTMVISNPEVEAIAPQLVAKGEIKARDILDRLSDRASAAGVAIERLVRHGQDAAHRIVDQAEKKQVDLIVMARRGSEGWGRMQVGSTTVKVCGMAPCSVMVVPRGGNLPRNRILVATDGSSHSEGAAAMAIRLGLLCGLPVTIVSVTLPGHNDQRRADATAAVERMRASVARAGLDVEGMTVEAVRPETGIVTTAAATGADLIIVGSHGRSGLLEKVLIGSVSERVIGDATCPVVVVRADLPPAKVAAR